MPNNTQRLGSLLWAVGTLASCFCILLSARYIEGLFEPQPEIESGRAPAVAALPAASERVPAVESSPQQTQSSPAVLPARPAPQQQSRLASRLLPPSAAAETTFHTSGLPLVSEPPPLPAPTPLTRTTTVSPPPSVQQSEGRPRPPNIAALIQSLTSRGVRAHASVSGDARTATLSIMGPTIKRETGLQWLGDRKVRDELKAAGIRIVVMMNGQESWTLIL